MIDAHVHFWDPARLSYTWLSELPSINRPFLPTDFFRESAGCGVEGVLFVQADCVAQHGLPEVAWVETLALLEPRIQGIVAFAPMEKGMAAFETLSDLACRPLVKGVRRLIQGEAPGFCAQAEFLEAVRRLPEFGLSFDLCLKQHQLGEVIALVDHCPKTDFILDHGAKPAIAEGLWEPWHAQITDLSRRPNIVCKISGLITEAHHSNWSREELKPYIDHLLESFGPNRVLFGGDWPVSKLAGGYRAWWEALQWTLMGIDESTQRALLSENARRVYRLPANPS